MSAKYDIQLMVKVAEMYYIEGLKQEEIAKELKISRSLISMIIAEAKEMGIVEINIRNPLLNNNELSKKFERLFNLNKCFIIPTAVQNSDILRKLVAQRAVDIFNQEVDNGYNVGIAWGRTCYEFISSYKPETDLEDINIVPLIGGSDQNAQYFQINEMVRIFADRISGTPHFIHAPALTSSLEEKELLMGSPLMQNIKEKWANINIAISGVGILPNLKKRDRETYIGENEIYDQLAQSGAVGDICARYFNIDGEFIKDNYYDRIIGIPIEDLRKSNEVICVASGKEKVYAILGALRTGIIDIFVTDSHTAKAVLKFCK